MYLVGLTGGIGSGKSAVSSRLAEHGVEVIDADVIAREVVTPEGPALPGLVERFGEQILQPDGQLDRAALAALAFATDEAREDLDRLTHPHIAARIAARIAELGALRDQREQLVVVDHPLLIETGQASRFDAVVVVETPEDLRIERLVTQRKMDEEDVRARMRGQATDAERRRVATHVIRNDQDLQTLWDRTDELLIELRTAARRSATAQGS